MTTHFVDFILLFEIFGENRWFSKLFGESLGKLEWLNLTGVIIWSIIKFH